ncbi:MAG: Panacea domain-containing protein [Butyricicoccus sp.]
MYSALDIARYVIWYCQEQGYIVSNLKLQKILYFIQAQFLVFNPEHNPCFREQIEAWTFGPVVPVVYRQYRLYGNAHIPSLDDERDFDVIRIEDRNMIDNVVDQCADYTAAQLVELTHNQTPWMEAYERGRNSIITATAIRSFFE